MRSVKAAGSECGALAVIESFGDLPVLGAILLSRSGAAPLEQRTGSCDFFTTRHLQNDFLVLAFSHLAVFDGTEEALDGL
ncbi:MAG: hypothetical protein L0I62_05680 [Gammaproteobacteria bacterium]|nr:hypothetical protein [Gammaproteobacteria bacterium]